MSERYEEPPMPPGVQAIRSCGYVRWAGGTVAQSLRERFAPDRIPVLGIRHVRVWGLQVELEARDGSRFEVNSELVVAAPA
jgi:hypothetical protein